VDHASIDGIECIGNVRLHLADVDRCGLDQSILVPCLGGRDHGLEVNDRFWYFSN
jgi:hypothetical protein